MRIDDLIGKPYKHGARGPDEFDCAGLAVFLQERKHGIKIPVPESVESEARNLISMQKIISSSWVELAAPVLDCLIFFTGAHVGTYIGYGRFIHTSEAIGHACIERLKSPLWCCSVRGFYEFAGSPVATGQRSA